MLRTSLLALVGLCTLFANASTASAQRAEPGVRGMLDRPEVGMPAARYAPIDAIFRPTPFTTFVTEWTRTTSDQLAAEPRAMLHRLRFVPDYERGALAQVMAVADTIGSAADSISFLPPPPPTRTRTAGPAGAISEYADLGLRVQGVGNLGGNWTQHKPCDPAAQFTCNPGIFPQLRPDVQFGVRVAGTVSDRVHVDVDYDQTREFEAANNIKVFYQGLADEVLQRLDVGDVSIRLPSTRYMTRGIPAGNFGFAATAQLGPIDTIQVLFAQQKGDVTTKEFKLGAGGQAGLEQDAELVIDDADYAKGQFFFLVPPDELLAYPHVDALALRSTDAPAVVRPGVGGTIQVYRDERIGAQQPGSQVGYFLADAVPVGGGLRHTGSFRRLTPQQDYIVHSSGLWVMLRSPLRADEALAVSFITETGDTIGVMNAETAPAGARALRLLRGPTATHQPGSSTWPMEMHQVYRLDSSSDVDLSTVDMRISLGEAAGGRTFRDVLGQQLSFLRFFGLDEDAPADRLDAAQVFQPARNAFDTGGSTPIGGTFIFFPTLRPFFEPGPLASARLSGADLTAALGRDANEQIYENPDPIAREAAARFRLNFRYRVKVEGLVTSFNLGAFGIREESERIYFGGRLLQRDVDYTIEYEIGTVTLNDAATLFATTPNAELRATWEQKPLFNIAPTSVFGARARYSLGTMGQLNFVGLYQAEKSLMTRPQLGAEPGASFVGGMSGSVNLGGRMLDRVLGVLPNVRGTRQSSVILTGELAFSMPDPNRRGAAYLDDFEASDEIGLSVRRQDWKLGSAPQSTEGDRNTLPFTRNAATALPLVWQHDFVQDGSVRGAMLPRSQIDNQINIIGNELPEPVMWLTFGREGVTGDPGEARRWRSLTTVLSTTGRDMTRAEYLEFYVQAGRTSPLALIFDIGVVSEDAFYVDSLGRTNGIDDEGRRWGLGELDEEARLIERDVWGTDKDQRGLWDQECQAEPITVYPLRDPRANCTRGNGYNDTEDLNGNGVLDRDDGQYFRYVVQLDQASEFLVRDTAATGTGYRLYRIPLRNGVPVNGANDGTWRFIRHMRMTIAGEPGPGGVRLLTLARMRVIGSRWTKRDIHGVQRGMIGSEPGSSAASAEVRVGPVSSLTDGAQYSPPPGVIEQLQDPTQQFGGGGTEINEKSLRIAYDNLSGGDRAEIYYRYPQQPRDMRMYRELRLWVLPRAGSWGPDGSDRFTLRIGSDPNNYYLFQTKLQNPTGPRPTTLTDWLPEIVVDFQKWLELRAEAELLGIERGRGIGADTVWSADSAYAIVLEDLARAPNLGAVRELIFAVYNGGPLPSTGEIWLDEMRIGIPDREAGRAANVAVDLVAGDLFDASFVLSNQGGRFRQLGDAPTYVGGTDLQIRADTRLDQLLPASWGVELPLSISHDRNAQDPTYLQSTDVIADRLTGLRETGNDATRIGLRLRKKTPTANPWLSLLLDGPALRVSYVKGGTRSVTSESDNGAFVSDISYMRALVPRTLDILPAVLEALLRTIAPATVEESGFFTRLVGSQLRWSPASLSFGTTYSDQLTRSYLYDRILALPGDSAVRPIESPRQGMRNDVTLGLQPFSPLTASLTLSSDRDLLAAERASNVELEQRALRNARSSFAGMDVGWEAARVLTTNMSYAPNIANWLRAGYSFDNRFMTERNPSYLQLDVTGADTLPELQRGFESTRQVSRTLRLEPTQLARTMDSTSIAGKALGRVQIIDITWRDALSSQFERRSFTPGAAYQFGLGDYDSFRVMNGDTATRAQQRADFRTNVGIAVLGSATLSASYAVTDVEAFDQRGGVRKQHDVTWPSASMMLRDVRIPERIKPYLVSLGGSFGAERTRRREEYTGAVQQQRGVTDWRYPLSLQLGFTRGFTLSYRGSLSGGETLDPTGDSEKGGHQHDLTLSAIVRAPESWRARLTAPISVFLQFTDQNQQQCRYNPILAAADGCVAFLDVGTRNANLKLETEVSDITVGSSFSFVDRANQVGTRAGSSQFQFQLYGRFNFTAGQMPAGTY